MKMTPDVMSPVGGSFCRRLRVARVGPAKALSPSRPDGRLLQQSYVSTPLTGVRGREHDHGGVTIARGAAQASCWAYPLAVPRPGESVDAFRLPQLVL